MRKNVCRKALVLFLAVVLLTSTMHENVQAKAKGYQFTYKKATVYMGGPAKNLISKAGKPLVKKVKKSCAYKGKDRTYKYKDFILYTYSNSEKGEEYVNGITFLTKNAKTAEGIKIGSTYSQVKKKYGKGKDNFGIYTYKKSECKLQIEITDGKVTKLRYIKA